jgi:hypothetical protein
MIGFWRELATTNLAVQVKLDVQTKGIVRATDKAIIGILSTLPSIRILIHDTYPWAERVPIILATGPGLSTQ